MKAQQRNVWRAILPHAIANRLAELALQKIPLATIEAQLVNNASDRIRKSCSRRLGFLDSSRHVIQIVEAWLGENGRLGDLTKLSLTELAMFSNVAPVAPEATLSALERAMRNGGTAKVRSHARLLRSLAWEAKYFERTASILAELAEEDGDSDTGSALSIFKSMFPIYHSGTHATIEQRLGVIERLLSAPATRARGMAALRQVSETGPFRSSYDFEFGARSRDHGYRPRTRDDIRRWFGAVLKFAEQQLASSDRGDEVQSLLASRFRGMWSAGMGSELDALFSKIAERGFGREGWIAARQTQQYDAKDMEDEEKNRLAALEKRLRPVDLVGQVRAIVLSGKAGRLDLDEYDEAATIEEGLKKRQELVLQLGEAVAKDAGSFEKLLPELIAGRGSNLRPFACGMARGASDPKQLWDKMHREFAKSPATANAQVLQGYLGGQFERDAAFPNSRLDEALDDPVLKPIFPLLQTSIPIDAAGVNRLKKHLKA